MGFRQARCRPYQGGSLARFYSPPEPTQTLRLRGEVAYTLNSAEEAWQILELTKSNIKAVKTKSDSYRRYPDLLFIVRYIGYTAFHRAADLVIQITPRPRK